MGHRSSPLVAFFWCGLSFPSLGLPGSGPVRIGVWIRTAPDRTPGSYLRPLTKPLTRWVAISPRGKRRTHACARAPFPYSSKNPTFGRRTNASQRSFRSCCRHRLMTKLRTLRSINYVLRLEVCLVAEEDVVAECISKVGFWRRKTQSVVPHFSPTNGVLAV